MPEMHDFRHPAGQWLQILLSGFAARSPLDFPLDALELQKDFAGVFTQVSYCR